MSEKKMNMKGLIYILLLSIVGLAFTPSIQSSVSYITHANNGTSGFPAGGNNLTGSSRTILALFPLFWVILMIAFPVTYVAVWLKGA